MRLAFMGTPAFAVPCLESLIQAGHTVCAAYTQPDKPKGRGYAMTPPPVKECALAAGIPVFQPATLRDGRAHEQLRELAPDCIVVVAYGKILPPEILRLPKKGCVNVHASLLPRYRGAAPIQWSVIRGEQVTGVTTMRMDEGLDTGDLLLQAEQPIGPDTTSGELHDQLSLLGARLIVQTLAELEAGTLTATPQNDGESTYAPMLDKNLSRIDWNKTAGEVHNLIRGLNPWPTAQTTLEGRVLKIHKSCLSPLEAREPGAVVSLSPLSVGCGDGGCVELLEVQLAGKKRMSAQTFLLGHPVEPGTRLGG